MSENLLSLYLDEYEDTPWDALKYLISGVNYGGHVTDDWDRRLLTTYINDCFCEQSIATPFYRYGNVWGPRGLQVLLGVEVVGDGKREFDHLG